MRNLVAKSVIVTAGVVLAWLAMPHSHAIGALIAHYTFDDGTGQTAADETGNYNGTLGANGSAGSDDPTWTAQGVFGGALSFDGGDYVSIGASIIPTSGPFTVMGWGKTATAQNGAMIGQGGADPGRLIVYHTRVDSGNIARLYFDGGQAVGSTVTNDDQWHHVAVTRSSGNLFTLYVDGAPEATLSRSANVNTANTYLGTNTSSSYRFNGTLDDIGLFDTALDADDIKYLATYGAGSDYLNRSTWHNTDWDCRQAITVSSDVTTADLTDFPLLVKITDPSNPVFNRAAAGGLDILFTDANGNKLSHEIESYSNGATKELNAWVKVDLASAADTTLYMYYDNDTASDQQNAVAT